MVTSVRAYSGFRISFCNIFTYLKVEYSNSLIFDRVPSIIFTLELCQKQRYVKWHLKQNFFIGYFHPHIAILGVYAWNGSLIASLQEIGGLLKANFLLLAGYAISFKKRFYLSGQVNRMKRLSRHKFALQLGFSHKIRIRGLKKFLFRRWRRKKFGIRVKSNDSNLFSAFVDLFRNIRLRGQYTSRGVRLRGDRFKMKFRPDHGKYGFKMNY